MNDEQLTKLWGVVTLALLFYVINTWISSQGAHPFMDVELLDSRRIPGALMALVVGPPLLSLAAAIGLLYAARHSRTSWWLAVLTPGVGTLDRERIEARIYIISQLIIAYLLPILSFIHFFQIVLEADVCARKPEVSGLSVWAVPELTRLNSGYRLDGWDHSTMQCNGGLTFWPLVEPVILMFWILLPIVLVAWHAWQLAKLPGK